jgi:WD40-like Beta Propeller Repeat
LWLLALPELKSGLFLKASSVFRNGQFSPDGKWVAYASNETGKWEIGSVRITGSTSRRQRMFVVTQIGASFLLLAGASMLITTLIGLQKTQTGMDTRHVLAINVPAMFYGKTNEQVVGFYKELMHRIDALPGVNKTAYGGLVPWRDVGGPRFEFSADGHVLAVQPGHMGDTSYRLHG